MEASECPHSSKNLSPASFGRAAAFILLDWKIWAIAFAFMFGAALILQALGFNGGAGAGGAGAAIGLLIATRMGMLVQCNQCGSLITLRRASPETSRPKKQDQEAS